MSNDLELRMRFTADNRGVAGTVRDTRKQVSGLSRDLSGASSAAGRNAGSMASVTTAGEEATRMFRVQKGALQQAGFQFQDLAVQIGGGTSAFVAIGQQGSQLLGVLGPGGALLGALLAIGSVIGGTLYNALGDGEEATKALDAALKTLDNTIEMSDGVPELTRQIKELARESEVAARGRISSALLAAEDAAKTAARGIAEAFGELPISDMFGMRDLEDFTESLGTFEAYLQTGYIQDDLRKLGELFGFSGERAQSAGREVAQLLTQLRANPSFENFQALENSISQFASDGDDTSETITRLIGNLGGYFDAARDAGERTEALKSALKNLSDSIKDEASEEIDSLVEKLRVQSETLGLSTLEMIEYNRQADLSAVRDADASEEKSKLINKYYDEIYAHEQNTIASKKEKEAQEELTRAQREYREGARQLINELDPLGAQFESVFEKQQALIKLAADGDISQSYRDTLIRNLVDGMAEGGDLGADKAAEAFQNRFEGAANSVAQSLQDAIASGDWDSLGDAIGGALATSIAGVVNQSITDSLAENITKDSGTFAQIGAAFAGPIVGAVAGGLAQLAFTEIADFLGGSDWDPTERRQANQGTGTVLAEINVKSESIAKAVDISADATTELVGINRSMLRALEQVQLGISGATSMVARQRSGMAFETNDRYSQAQLAGGGLGIGIGGVTTGSFGPAFGLASSAYSLVDEALGGILSDGMEFLDNLTGGLLSSIGSSVFGGDQKVVDEGIRIIGGNLSDLVNRTLVQAYASIKEDGGWFSSDKRFDRFQNISTNQFALVFESIYDAVEQGADALGILPSQVQSRLDNFVVETQRISLEGLNAEEQQAELEAVFSTIFDDLAGSVVPFVSDFQQAGEGLGETLARIATQVQVTEQAVDRLGVRFSNLSGRELVAASTRLIELTGGLDTFISGMQGLIQNFASDARQFEIAFNDISIALGNSNLALPDNREGYLDLVQAQDASTQAGAENIATLLRLQDAADTYYSFLENAQEESQRSAIEAQQDILGIQQQAFRESLQEAQRIAGSVSRALDGLTITGQQFERASRERALESLGMMARTGNVSAGPDLDASLAAATNIQADQFSTFNDYIEAVSRTGATLTSLQRVADNQVSREARLLGNIERQLQNMTQRLTAVLEPSEENTAKTARILERIDRGGLKVRE